MCHRFEAMQMKAIAECLELAGTKRFRTAERMLAKRCGAPGERNRCITRSRFRSGRCEFSARLFNPLCDRCSTVGITCRRAAPKEASLSLTMRFGRHPCFFISRISRRLAALVLRRA